MTIRCGGAVVAIAEVQSSETVGGSPLGNLMYDEGKKFAKGDTSFVFPS